MELRGFVLANLSTGYYYMIGLKNNATGWFLGVYKYTGTTTKEPGGPVLPALYDTRLTGVIRGIWFYITASFIVYPNGTSAASVWLYNATGGSFLVASFTVIDPAPITGVSTIGVRVYQIRNKPSAVFQMIGFMSYMFFVIISGLTYCCYVYVYDPSGVLIGQGHVNETGVVVVELKIP